MAGIGGSWGSREEMLHPRDKRGRFRKTWKMAQAAIDAITNFLDKFQPRTFQSDSQAAHYVFNKAKPSRFGGGQGYPRLHADLDETNEHLRVGDIDESTRKFVTMMDDSAINLPEPLILSRTVNADAFGLTPQTLGSEQGGLEDLTGWVIKDPGYSTHVIGTPMGHGPGKVTMTIATPKGTKAIIPARSQNDRAVFLDRDQEFAVTKVEPDGTGGYYMMAVAVPKTGRSDHEPLSPGPRGEGLTPQQREQRVLSVQQAQGRRQKAVSDTQLQQEAIAQGNRQVLQEQPQTPPPVQTNAPQAPGGPEPRNEPVLKESVGGPAAGPEGRTTAEIAQTLPPAPEAPPAAPIPTQNVPPNFRESVRAAGLTSPSEGPRRRQWNNAYLGVASGKNDPADKLRELDRDIDVNKHILADRRARGTDDNDPHLADDIDAQEQLADLIAKNYGLQRTRKEEAPAPAPVKKAAPGEPTPITKATGTKRKERPGEAGTKEVGDLNLRRAEKGLGSVHREPVAPPTPEPKPETPKKATPKKAAPEGVTNLKEARQEKTRKLQESLDRRRKFLGQGTGQQGPETPPPPTKASGKKATVTSLEEVRARKANPKAVGPETVRGKTQATALKPGTKVMVERDSEGNLVPEMVRGDGEVADVRGVNPDGTLDVTLPDGTETTTIKRTGEGAQMPRYRTATPTEERRAAKKAASGGGGGGEEPPSGGPDLDKMTKAELLAEAERQNVRAPKSWTKDKIKQEIRRIENEKIQPRPAGVFSENPAIREAAIAESDRIRAEGNEAARKDRLLADLAKDIGIKGDAGGLIPARQADLKEGLSEAEVADKLFQDADRLEASPMPAPGSDKVITEDMRRQREEAVSNLRTLAARLRARNMVEPNAPAAQKLVETPDRRKDFSDAWMNRDVLAHLEPNTAANRSIIEVRDDILAGRITPDEGIRRLENDIDINKQDLADVERELRGDIEPRLRSRLFMEQDKLREAIKNQETASGFIRSYHRKAPVITPEEVKLHVGPEVKDAIDKATPDDIKEAARITGHGEIKGDTKEEILQNLLKKMAGDELARRAKKAAPKKLAPQPLVTKKSSDPDYVDARSIAEGLGMDGTDEKMLNYIQELLDGTETQRPMTPAAVGRRLEQFANGPAGPAYSSATLIGVNGDNLTPEQQKEHDALRAQFGRWMSLSERLKNTRRRPVRKATEPTPQSPKLSTQEKATTREAAKLLDVEPEQLQQQVLRKRAKAAPASEGAKSAAETLKTIQDPEEGKKFLARRTKPELVDIAKASGVHVESRDTKAKLIDKIVDMNMAPKRFEVLTRGGMRNEQAPQGEVDTENRIAKPTAGDVQHRLGTVSSENEARQYLDSLGLGAADTKALARDLGVPLYANPTKKDAIDGIVKVYVHSRLEADAIRESVDMSGKALDRQNAATKAAKKAAPAAPTPDELTTIGELHQKANLANGWVSEDALSPGARSHVDNLVEKGWLQKHTSTEGAMYRIDPRSAGTQKAGKAGGALVGDIIPAAPPKTSEMALFKLNRGAVIEGHRKGDGRFGAFPKETVPDSERARIVIQRLENVDEEGNPTKSPLAPKLRVIGRDVQTGERIESDPVDRGTHFPWISNPEQATSGDIEGELAPEKPAAKAVKAATKATKTAPAAAPKAAKATLRDLVKAGPSSVPENLDKMSKKELEDFVRDHNIAVGVRPTKEQLKQGIRRVLGGKFGEGITFLRDKESAPNLEDMSPAELADIESELGIKRTSLDRGERIAAIRARQAGQAKSATMKRSLPGSGRKWNWETIQEDNMTMHGDSPSMQLAQALRKAGREEDAQYVADMRYRISNNRGEHDPGDVEKMMHDLRVMMEAEQDPGLRARYKRVLDDVDAPEAPAPELPKSTPAPLRKMMTELNQIPVARKSGHFAGTSKKTSAVERLAELIREIAAGKGGSTGTVRTQIESILRSLHESVDGAFQMWRLEPLLEDPELNKWIRSFYT